MRGFRRYCFIMNYIMTKFADKRLPVYFHVVGLFGVFLAIAIAMRFQTLGNPVLEPDGRLQQPSTSQA